MVAYIKAPIRHLGSHSSLACPLNRLSRYPAPTRVLAASLLQRFQRAENVETECLVQTWDADGKAAKWRRQRTLSFIRALLTEISMS